MTTASGTSNGGWQVLLSAGSVSSGILNLYVPSSSVSEPIERGYYYVFSQVGGSGKNLLIVDRGIMYEQGIVKVYGSALFPSACPGYVGVRWKYSGIGWTCVLS